MKFKLFLITIFVYTCITVQAQASKADSLEARLKKNNITTEDKLNVYDSLCWIYFNVDIKMAIEYAEEGIKLGKKTKNTKMTALLLRDKGIALYMQGEYSQADDLYKEALPLAIACKDEIVQASIYGSMANVYQVTSQYKSSLDNYQKALSIYERIGLKSRIAITLANIGAMYNNMFHDEQAEKYILKALQLSIEIGDKSIEAQCYDNLFSIARNKNQDDEALQYAKKSAKLYGELGFELQESNAYSKMALTYIETENFTEAISILTKALEITKNIGSVTYNTENHRIIARAYLLSGNLSKAIEHTRMALLNLDRTDYQQMAGVYSLASKVFIETGDKQLAFAYSDSLSEVQYALSDQELQEAISDMEIQYETEKKELKIISLHKEKQMVVLIAVSVSLFSLFFIVALIYVYKLTKKKKQLAEQQVIRLEKEKQLIATQAILEGETEERTRLSRDLHDGLGGLLSVVKLNLNEMNDSGMIIEKEDVGAFKRVIEVLDESINELRRISHFLMPQSLNRYGIKVALSDFCSNIKNVSFSYFGEEEPRLEQKFEIAIYRIVYELVNNAIKYANASEILVQIIREQERLAVTVQDNGNGFDTSKVTQGNGINNIRSRVEAFGGAMFLYSNIGQGTEFSMEFNIKN